VFQIVRLWAVWIAGLAAFFAVTGWYVLFVGIVVIVDNLVYLVYFPLILTCKRWAKPFNKFTGVSDEQVAQFFEATAEIEKKTHEVHFRDVLTLIGWGFVTIVAARWVAGMVPEFPPVLTVNTWTILLVTTFGVLLSATPLKDVPGTEPLSMSFVYLYMTMIGATADLRVLGEAHWFLVAGFVAIAVHLLFVIFGAKLLRLDVSMAAVSSVACVGGAASAPVAAGYHREELVPVSIMLALIGYALGNYLGVATAYLCNLVT